MLRVVKRSLSRIKKHLSARQLCVDEVALKKGHQCVTVISDRQGRALKLIDDSGVESLASYLRSLSDHQLDEIKTLSMDMNMAYISATRSHLTNAVDKIAFDHFHVVKTLCAVVDKRVWQK